MSVWADLSEEEAYLWAILQDPSGIDPAEFTWYESSAEGECWRAWPFQWAWWHATDRLQIDSAGRSVGKSTGISVRSYSFCWRYPGKELVLTAPEALHLDLITQKIEQRIMSVRLAREMITKKRQIRHRPFEVDFQNGARILGRIPHRDGSAVKGTHGIVLELDEGQNYPDEGWEELIETLNRPEVEEGQVDIVDESHWYVHGVTRGIRDYFHKFTLPESGWKVHKIPSMMRPGWTDQERDEKIAMYGSRNAPSYRRNIHGDPGDAEASIFVMTRLMACVDLDESSVYNQMEYHVKRIASEGLIEYNQTIEQALELPASHLEYGEKYATWGGADLGMTSHPSEFLIFVEIPQKGAKSLFKLISRFHLERVRAGDQVSALIHLMDYYNIKAFGLDKTGLGLPIYQDLQDRAPEYLDKIKGYNFSSKILVDFDKSIHVDDIKGDRIKDAGIEKNVLEESTDVLRRLVDTNRFRLPSDMDVIKEFQGQTYCCDEETKIFTNRGWLKFNEVRVGDFTLGIEDHNGTPESRWDCVSEVSIFDKTVRNLTSMTGQCHNSLTTSNHKWLTKPYNHAKYLNWKTTANLCDPKNRQRIPITAIRTDINRDVIYKDDFVELVAWFYTEGNFVGNNTIAITQSPSANLENCERIERLLFRMMGTGHRNIGQGRRGGGPWSLTEGVGRASNYRILDEEICGDVRAIVGWPDKIVSAEFLVNLTETQLDLFIEVCLLGDGCCFTRTREHKLDTDVRTFKQANEGRIENFEMACALRGIGTHTVYDSDKPEWRLSLLWRNFTHNTSHETKDIQCEGIVWCPTTSTGTWLAKREGSVYFTGNTNIKTGMDQYGRTRRFSTGTFHALDASRMAALAHSQHNIEELIKPAAQEDVIEVFLLG